MGSKGFWGVECRALVGTIGPGKGGESVGGIGCLADDTSNS